MKTFKNIKVLAIFTVVLFASVFPVVPAQAATQRLTMDVGDKTTVRFSTSKTITSTGWYSNDPAVQVVSSGVTSCTIKAVKATSASYAIVRCDYYYTELRGKYMYTLSGYEDFYITVSGDQPTPTPVTVTPTPTPVTPTPESNVNVAEVPAPKDFVIKLSRRSKEQPYTFQLSFHGRTKPASTAPDYRIFTVIHVPRQIPAYREISAGLAL